MFWWIQPQISQFWAYCWCSGAILFLFLCVCACIFSNWPWHCGICPLHLPLGKHVLCAEPRRRKPVKQEIVTVLPKVKSTPVTLPFRGYPGSPQSASEDIEKKITLSHSFGACSFRSPECLCLFVAMQLKFSKKSTVSQARVSDLCTQGWILSRWPSH